MDDELIARKILPEFVEQVPFLDLQGKFENAAKAEAFLSQQEVDLIFLDIEKTIKSGSAVRPYPSVAITPRRS